jgi:uncharacterized protein
MASKLLLFTLLAAAVHTPLDPADARAFRLWFTFLAEAQYFTDPAARPPEITDCSSLVRYAFRETFAKHDTAWKQRNPLPGIPALPAVKPRPGPFFDTPQGPRHFADAKTLMRRNAVRIGDSLDRALPGDLLFYEQVNEPDNWHVMIFLGPSQLDPSPEKWVLYHTGPTRNSPGEMRRLSTAELLNHPQPRWRPVRGNAAYRGLYRWRILAP